MSIFKKNDKSNGGAFADGFGKTEPGNFGGNFVGTEPLNEGMSFGGNVGVTTNVTSPVNDGPWGPAPGGIEDIGHTIKAGDIEISTGETVQPVVGWLVCIKGPNLGLEFRIHSDYNYVGSQYGDIVIPGDNKISREKHMIITYDPTDRLFYIAPASGANIIRLNDKALIGGGQQLKNYDIVSTGDSAFVFIGFCGESFGWEQVING